MGLFGNSEELGLEGSGIIRRAGGGQVQLKPGDRVAMLSKGVNRTRVTVQSSCCFKVPDHISLEDAATMPSVYITSVYCLVHLARLQKGEVRHCRYFSIHNLQSNSLS